LKILATTPHPAWPVDSGPAARTVGIARALAERGHEVTVLGPGTAPPAPPPGPVRFAWYAARGPLGHFSNRDFRRAYRRLLAERPALVVSSYPYQSFMLMGAARRAGVPVVYDAQNVEAERFRALGRPLRARLVRRAESYACSRARAVLAVTAEDQALLRREYGCRAGLLPNGVDVARFHPGPPDEALLERYGLRGRRVVLFFGALGYPPNRDALGFLLRRAWPAVRAALPDAALLLVGGDPPRFAEGIDGVVVAGRVDDMVAHLRLAHVVAVPLQSGGGMRLKIVESLACGQTVLSTAFGAVGLPRGDDGALILAETDTFAARLIALLQDPPARGANAAARRLALSFDWGRLVGAVDWDGLANGGGPPEGRAL
jgi:glycosyltransferase involved in cell wall biosynthesis